MLIIDQALWGYSGGHHLLASSVILSNKSIKIMEPLTDLSGSEMAASFDGYLTGCYLPSDKCYAISKTWYAAEMPRQGCVWTHTILIKDGISCKQSNLSIEGLFHKPDVQTQMWKDEYSKSIILPEVNDNNNSPMNSSLNPAVYDLFSVLTENFEPIILSAFDVEFPNKVIAALIDRCGASFFRDISFCTGSFSNRSINRVQLDLQIVPEVLSKQVFRSSQRDTIFINDLLTSEHDKECSGLMQKQEDYINIRSFIHIYGEQYYKRLYWSTFSKMFFSVMELETFSLENTISELLEKLTDEEISKIVIKLFNYIFLSATPHLNFSSETIINVLFQFLTIPEWFDSYLNINTAIGHLWIYYRQDITFLLIRLLHCDVNVVGENAIKYIPQLMNTNDYSRLIGIDIYACLSILPLNMKLALCPSIWLQPENTQIEALRVLADISTNSSELSDFCHEIIYRVFDVSDYSLSRDLYRTFNDDSINAYFDYFDSDKSSPKKLYLWCSLCNFNQRLALKRLTTINNPELFKATISVLNPYSPDLAQIPPELLEAFFKRFCGINCNQSIRIEYAQFVLPIILRSDSLFSRELVQFAFCSVHTMLANNKMSFENWEKLSDLLPEVAWYNSWDKCKRLRKAAKQRKLDIYFDQQ